MVDTVEYGSGEHEREIDLQEQQIEPEPGAPFKLSTLIRTPDYRLRIFISSTLQELQAERQAAAMAIRRLRLAPVLFELGARPHPPRELYRAYLEQSHVFIGIYWQSYGWISPEMEISGLEDEYHLAGDRPRLIYIKEPAPGREPRLTELLDRIRAGSAVSYKRFRSPEELRELIENDLALLLTERFETVDLVRDDAMTRGATTAVPRVPTLPVPASPIIGREAELATVVALLEREDVRLVTLSGTGGIGKTRLSLAVAAQLERAFEDGVRFVDLSAIRDPASVAPAIAQALSIREGPGQAVLETLSAALRTQRMLLILDNFEHVIGAAPVVGHLLASSRWLKVLVTSRTPLRLAAEHDVPVPPLSLPAVEPKARAGATTLEMLDQSAAVRLFVERSKAVRHDFRLTADNAAAVAEICRRLDGIPLAIELAAARSKILPPQAILSHLGSRLDLLTSGSRDAPARHQTLRAALDWSYDLLASDEQALFSQLGVFVHGFSLEAASAVAGEPPAGVLESAGALAGWARRSLFSNRPVPQQPEGSPAIPLALVDSIQSLVEKSLLSSVPGYAGEPRFAMLETLREYALRCLSDAGDDERVRQRHAWYFVGFSEKAWRYLRGADAAAWFERLAIEHDNIRSALYWAVEREPILALRLATALGEFWDARGLPSLGRHWLESAIAKVEPEESSSADLALLCAVARLETMRLAFRQSEYGPAMRLARSVAEWARRQGEQRVLIEALAGSGMLSVYAGDPMTAIPLLEEGLRLARADGYEMGILDTLQHLGAATLFLAQFAEALVYLEESLARAQSLGAARWIANAYVLIGFAELAQGALARAADVLVEAGRYYWQVNDIVLAIYPLSMLAEIALARGQLDRAGRLLGIVEELLERTGTMIMPVFAERLATTEGTLRSQLGEESFQAARVEGKAMTPDQAIAYALGREGNV
ncbi:DUF4062 domain-containing protein [Thermomicrobiaceae bacterium CFH 74404]|uniref:DUF4062 domain-containing protein n=1 Tax=Thermalbibacter longus TaxID=2951981 RepID=A0AA42BA75_9BACT|nr:DUF4062 domain-containing protein [Thermalbibacter longus]MCM8748199.1 DUF4062 domain-containing protein [Thermalbibacter longus]